MINIEYVIDEHNLVIISASLSNDDSMIVVGYMDSSVIIYDTSNGGILYRHNKHEECVTSVSFNHNDRLIVSSS